MKCFVIWSFLVVVSSLGLSLPSHAADRIYRAKHGEISHVYFPQGTNVRLITSVVKQLAAGTSGNKKYPLDPAVVNQIIGNMGMGAEETVKGSGGLHGLFFSGDHSPLYAHVTDSEVFTTMYAYEPGPEYQFDEHTWDKALKQARRDANPNHLKLQQGSGSLSQEKVAGVIGLLKYVSNLRQDQYMKVYEILYDDAFYQNCDSHPIKR